MGRGRGAVAAVVLLAACGLVPARADANTYKVGNCVAGGRSYSTEAFGHFLTRGMVISQRCAPQTGQKIRGLGIGSVSRRGRVERGAVAQLTIDAPAGTAFKSYAWTGVMQRLDCRYVMQIYAVFPNAKPRLLKREHGNRRCGRRASAAAYNGAGAPFQVDGATQIVQRVVCAGPARGGCAAGSGNRMWTQTAVAELEDVQAPTATIRADTPLTTGQWVNGTQALNYEAADNVGVRSATAFSGGSDLGGDDRPCRFASPGETFVAQVPCVNGPGSVSVNTQNIAEGTNSLVVRAYDPAGNAGESAPIDVHIDRTPPSRVDVAVEGGQDWRSRNDFAVWWTNPPEVDRAPIVAATYKLCPVAGGDCLTGTKEGADIARLDAPVPGPGQWNLSLWRRDAAGNESQELASVPVTLRYDPEPPQLAFEPSSPSDPTLVALTVKDTVSGVADGSIEISPAGSGTWQTLPVTREGDRWLARIDDATLPPGPYELRARASDLARNEASTNLRADGQPMLLNLPIRVVATLQSAFERQRQVKRKRVVVQTQAARVLFGETATVAGRLVNPAGEGIAGAQVQILATTPIGAEQLIDVLETGADGSFRYAAAGGSSRVLRLVYAGSPNILPAQSQLTMTVPAATALRVSRKRLRNGQTVTFSGPLRTLPTPPGGKLLEMQVRLPGRWETFKTIRTDADGKWSVRYRFRRTFGVQHYRFRARLPAEGAYPFTAGVSRVVTVRVRGA
ncbi:MAG TPA: hypothetical protein VNS09_12215 [Solirubrobacter sp.]|nr:hypothetical protein [Solirubrobacter sp.]